MDRVDERRILVDRHLRRHHIIRDSPDRTRHVPPDRRLIIVHDENICKRKMLLDPLSNVYPAAYSQLHNLRSPRIVLTDILDKLIEHRRDGYFGHRGRKTGGSPLFCRIIRIPSRISFCSIPATSCFVSITLSGFTLILTAPSRTRNSTTSG